MDPAMQRPNSQDMTYPLSSYWIMANHDTYFNVTTGEASAEMYINALNRGARCLELDVWDSVLKDSKQASNFKPVPVISHQSPSVGALPLEVVLKIVYQFIASNPDTFPILLNIENPPRFIVG